MQLHSSTIYKHSPEQACDVRHNPAGPLLTPTKPSQTPLGSRLLVLTILPRLPHGVFSPLFKREWGGVWMKCGRRVRTCAQVFVALALCLTAIHYFSPLIHGASSPAGSGVAFGPTVPNTQPPPSHAPKGMVWIPGGEFSMGAQDPPGMDMVGMKATTDSRPIHRVYVDGFFMDKTDVTNAQFAEFVKATGYVTIAEKTPFSRGLPRRSAGKSIRRQRGIFSSGSCRQSGQSLSMVELRQGRELAAPHGTQEFHKGKRKLSCRPSCFPRCRSLCEMGPQTSSYRSRVGICRSRWFGRQAICLG